MISIIQPIPVGNALRLFIEPPVGSTFWRVLRKAADNFTGQDDSSALVVYEGDEKIFVDSQHLINEQMVFYKVYYRIGNSWAASATSSGTPSATYEDHSTEVLSVMRDRIERGLLVECQRGNFQPENGYISVYTAPPSLEQDLRFPLVTIHLDKESPAIRGLGDDISGDEFDSIGFDWLESEGWLAQVQLTIVGWTQNSDERIELRKAIRRLIVGNMQVLADQGIVQVEASFEDNDMVSGEFSAPIYQVVTSFSCIAPVRVGNKVAPIAGVNVQVI